MSLGGSRIDSLTIFLALTLVCYTLLVAGVHATFTNNDFIDPYSGRTLDINLGQNYENVDFGNITYPYWITSELIFDDLDPDGRILWQPDFFADKNYTRFEAFRYGKDWFNGWVAYGLEPEEILLKTVYELYDFDLNASKIKCDEGGEFETHIFFFPLFYYNDTDDTKTFLYNGLEDSVNYGDGLTIVMATNATYESYDIFRVFGILTGFDTYDLPEEIAVITATIFWVLLILTIVKLVIG